MQFDAPPCTMHHLRVTTHMLASMLDRDRVPRTHGGGFTLLSCPLQGRLATFIGARNP
jgi:hypothetical protein